VSFHRDLLNGTLKFVVLRGFGKSRNESLSRGTRSAHLVLRGLCSLRLISFAALSALQCVAVCCSVLQCLAVRCSVLQCVAGNVGQFLWTLEEACCSCCSVLQCLAVCCSVLQSAAGCCSLLQCAAVCCRVLQCAAVCCRVL